jgi:hypothetical protein
MAATATVRNLVIAAGAACIRRTIVSNRDVQAAVAFANFCDVGRLYELEFTGQMPSGSANRFVCGGLAYLIRIVQLKEKFQDGQYPALR